MAAPLQAIRSVSLRYSVADAVRTALREGHLRPGENISEVAFAAQFSVSRGPVREALLVLVEEGLLTHSTNQGFSVVDLSLDDRAHIADLRLLLETRALELAREGVTPLALEQLDEMKGELVKFFSDRHRPARDALEIRFHRYIWDLSGNPWLVGALKRTLPLFFYGRSLGTSADNVDPALAHELHQLYIDYLAGKTCRTAEECVRFHMGWPTPALAAFGASCLAGTQKSATDDASFS